MAGEDVTSCLVCTELDVINLLYESNTGIKNIA